MAGADKDDEVYRDWLYALKDNGRARIQVRVERLAKGNPGQHRRLSGGVAELKINVGPGYRVYYSERGDELIILLGEKSTQRRRKTPRHQDSDCPRQGPFELATMRKKAAKPRPRTKTMPYDVADQLRTPEEMAAYLDAWLVEAPDDVAGIARALGDIARAKGMSKVARAAGLSRESLYKALSEDGNPSLATVLKVAKALGLRLHAAAA